MKSCGGFSIHGWLEHTHVHCLRPELFHNLEAGSQRQGKEEEWEGEGNGKERGERQWVKGEGSGEEGGSREPSWREEADKWSKIEKATETTSSRENNGPVSSRLSKQDLTLSIAALLEYNLHTAQLTH